MRPKDSHTIAACTAALAIALGSQIGLAAEQPVKLDLEAAKQYAVSHNYGITALRHEVEEARSRGDRSRSAFRPKVGVAGGVESENTPEANEAGAIAYLYGSYNLFNGYRDTYRSEIMIKEREKAEMRLKAAEFSVGLEVEQYFHTYLYKKMLIELKDKAITKNEEHQSYVSRSRAMGSISETDVMEFQLKDANLRSELVALKQELEDARSNLKRLLGEEIGTNIQPVGELQHQHTTGSLPDALAKIQGNAEAVKTMALDVAIANSERQITDARWLPEVDLEARVGRLPENDRIKDSQVQTSIMLVAKMELYSGGDASAEVREKTANAHKVAAKLKDEINVTIRKVEVGYRNLKVVEARADLERDNVTFARRYYDSVSAEYKRGFKNSYDLSNAADRLFEAEVRKVSLEFDFIKERIEVEKALGAPIDVENVPRGDAQKDPPNRDKRTK